MAPEMATTTTVTKVDGDSPEWSVVDSVVRVRVISLANGTETVFEPTLELGQAFSAMPRRLWDKALSSYGQVSRSGGHDSNGSRS